jgi:hypothetical protein
MAGNDDEPVAGDINDVHRVGAPRRSAAIAVTHIGTRSGPVAKHVVRASRCIEFSRDGELNALGRKAADHDTRRRRSITALLLRERGDELINGRSDIHERP